jgi:tetratricopeptide (TPR) repeat protein
VSGKINTLVFAACATLLLSSCGSTNAWMADFTAGKNAYAANPPQLATAEKSFKAALARADKDHVPSTQTEPCVIALGNVLLDQGKFAEAQEYLLRSVSLATATRMPVDAYIKQLQLLENAYERTRTYDQALQTAKVLVNYVNTEKSPFCTEYKQALAVKQRLESAVGSSTPANAGEQDACCKEHEAKAGVTQ